MTRRALVLGASGLVGGHVLQQVLANNSYKEVTIFVRKLIDIQHPKLVQKLVDFDKLDKYAEAFSADDIYVCVGSTIKKAGSQYAFRQVDYEIPVQAARLAAKNGAKQFLVISSLGADANARFFYMKTKGEMEEAVKKYAIPAIHIFHPSMLLGARKENRFGEKIGQLFMKLVDPLMFGSLKKYKGIRAETVAKAMIKTALENRKGIYTHRSDEIAEVGKE